MESIGILLTKLGERRKAIETHERSIKIFRAIGDKKLLSRALNNLGRVHSLLGERGQALEILAEALALAKEAKNKTSEAIALNGIGAIHYRLDDAARAEIYHIAALKLFEETEDVYNQSFTQTYLVFSQDSIDGSEQEAVATCSSLSPSLPFGVLTTPSIQT